MISLSAYSVKLAWRDGRDTILRVPIHDMPPCPTCGRASLVVLKTGMTGMGSGGSLPEAAAASVTRACFVDFMAFWRQVSTVLGQPTAACCAWELALSPEKGSDPGACGLWALSSATVTQCSPFGDAGVASWHPGLVDIMGAGGRG